MSDQRGIKKLISSMQSGITSIQRQGNSVFYTASIQQQSSEKSGWLKKQGGVVKSWHRRWFIIKGDHMYYFSTADESKPPLGYIFLPGNKVVEPLSNYSETDKFVFEIVPGGDKERMTSTHETYLLAATSDDERKDWVRVIRRVMYAGKGGAIFGQTLEETMRREQLIYNRKIPHIVEMCVEFLNEYGIQTEGIFRLTGRLSLIRKLREMFDCGERPDFDEMQLDVVTVASLLKAYLRELPEPIIPTNLYEEVMKAVTRTMPEDLERGLESLTAVLQMMPSYNYNLLQYLCHFLHKIHQNSNLNKMTETNLATVFSLSIIRPEDDDPALLMGTADGRSQVVVVLIQEVNTVFKLDYKADGTSVVVDNLLHIDKESTGFDVEAMSYFQVPRLSSQENDLLSFEDVSNEFTESLPEPMTPSNQGTDLIQDGINQGTICERLSDQEALHRSDKFSQRYTNKDNNNVTDSGSCDDGEDDEDDEAVFGSVQSSRLKNKLHEGTSAHSTQINSSSEEKNLSVRLPDKVVPVPTPRQSKLAARSECGKLDSSQSTSNDAEIDTIIENLIVMDMTGFTTSDYRSFIETLFVELKVQAAKVRELNKSIAKLKEDHQKEINKLKEELECEKLATARAVQKVVSLQSELQAYQMAFCKSNKN